MEKINILELVRGGKLVLVDATEIKELRKQSTEASAELKKIQRKRAETKDVVFECNCEGDPCTFIAHTNPDRELRAPTYCPNDGSGCRWKKV